MKKLALIIILVLLSSLLFPISAHAAATIDNPQSISIDSCQVVRNTIEDEDIAIIFPLDISYTDNFSNTDNISYPEDVLASESFYIRFYDTDGTTVLAETRPYRYINKGYDKNVCGFYFDSSISDLLTWGSAYKIGIIPNDIHFTSPPADYFYTLSSSNYTSKVSQQDNQDVITNYLLDILKDFEATYTGLYLLTSSDVGEVLTADGENWLRGAIPGIASIAPNLFYIQYYVPQTEDMNYDNSLSETYAERSSDWDITNGLNWLADETGLDSAGTVSWFIDAIICIIFTVFCAWKGWGVEPGLLGSMMISECGALLFGDTLMNIVLYGSLLAGIFIFFIIWLRRA
jgi:hypothetical protein